MKISQIISENITRGIRRAPSSVSNSLSGRTLRYRGLKEVINHEVKTIAQESKIPVKKAKKLVQAHGVTTMEAEKHLRDGTQTVYNQMRFFHGRPMKFSVFSFMKNSPIDNIKNLIKHGTTDVRKTNIVISNYNKIERTVVRNIKKGTQKIYYKMIRNIGGKDVVLSHKTKTMHFETQGGKFKKRTNGVMIKSDDPMGGAGLHFWAKFIEESRIINEFTNLSIKGKPRKRGMKSEVLSILDKMYAKVRPYEINKAQTVAKFRQKVAKNKKADWLK